MSINLKKKYVLLFGANGYFGKNILDDDRISFISIYRGNKNHIKNNIKIKIDINEDDLFDKLRNYKFDLAINLTTEKVDQSYEQHNFLNKNGLLNLIRFCNKNKITLIHFSSIAVDNIEKSSYDLAKFESEKLIKDNLNSGLIIRSHAIISKDYSYYYILKFLKYFIFLKNILPNSIKNYSLNSPIFINEAIKVLKKIIELNDKIFKNKEVKVYYLKGPDNCNLFEIFKENKNYEISELEKKINIKIKGLRHFF